MLHSSCDDPAGELLIGCGKNLRINNHLSDRLFVRFNSAGQDGIASGQGVDPGRRYTIGDIPAVAKDDDGNDYVKIE